LKGASDVAISPDGKTVYVAADGASPQADGSVAVFSRDPASGALRQLSGVAGCVSETGDNGDCADDRALDGATRVVVSGDGRYVYVASLFSDGIAVLSRDATTGELTQLSDSSGCITDIGAVSDCAIGHHLDYPHALAVSPDDKYVYVASVDSDAITTFARDDSTGALTQVSGAAGCIADGDGGGGCGPARALRGPLALAISPDGRRLYAASYYSHAIVAFARDAVTGGLTQLAGSDGCVARAVEGCAPGTGLTEVSALAITPDETNLYAASPSDSAISSFSLAGWSTPSCTAIDAPVAHDTATLVHLSCSEPDGDSLALSVATPPAHGTLSPIDNDTDTVTYTPTPGYAGTDDFSFRARDPDGWSDVAKATLHVSAAPPPPPEAVSKVWTEALARLASKRRCVASAPLRSQLTQPHQARIDAATLQINLRAAVVRRGSGVTHPVTFHRVPRGRFALRITLSLHDGRHLRTTRWYPACKTWANR
jgi:DNA-binding beta-propeller fold protein YncE